VNTQRSTRIFAGGLFIACAYGALGLFVYFHWAPIATRSWSAGVIYLLLLLLILTSLAVLVKAIGKVQTSELPLSFWIARPAIFAILFLTVVLSYGGDNFALNLGGFKLPLAWMLIAIVSILIGFRGAKLLFSAYPLLFILWIALFAGGICRLIYDLRNYGLWALRDSVFFLASVGLLFGMVLGQNFREHRWEHLVTIPIVVAVIYGLSYPWSKAISSVSPKSGVFVPVPLLGFHSNICISVAAVWGGFIGGLGTGFLILLLVAVTLLNVVLIQGRLLSMSLPITALFCYAIMFRAGKIGLSTKRVILLIGILFLLFSVTNVVPIPGRLGRFGLKFLSSHLGTILGKEGPGSGSVTQRYAEYPVVIKNVLTQPRSRLILGNGLGAEIDLGATVIYRKKAHLDYVEILYRVGIVSLFWFLTIFLIMGTVVRQTMRLMSDDSFAMEGQGKAVLLMICSLLVFSTIVSAFQPLFFWNYGAFPYYLYGGLALGVTKKIESELLDPGSI